MTKELTYHILVITADNLHWHDLGEGPWNYMLPAVQFAHSEVGFVRTVGVAIFHDTIIRSDNEPCGTGCREPRGNSPINRNSRNRNGSTL